MMAVPYASAAHVTWEAEILSIIELRRGHDWNRLGLVWQLPGVKSEEGG